MQIIPMRDLINTVEAEKRCAEEARMINRGIDDYEQDRVAEGKTTLQELRNKYGL